MSAVVLPASSNFCGSALMEARKFLFILGSKKNLQCNRKLSVVTQQRKGRKRNSANLADLLKGCPHPQPSDAALHYYIDRRVAEDKDQKRKVVHWSPQGTKRENPPFIWQLFSWQHQDQRRRIVSFPFVTDGVQRRTGFKGTTRTEQKKRVPLNPPNHYHHHLTHPLSELGFRIMRRPSLTDSLGGFIP